MAVQLIQCLKTMMEQGGSDLHLASNSSPMIRVRGEMIKVDPQALTPQEVESMISQITTNAQKQELVKEKSLDFAFKAQGLGVFRVNVFYQRHGLSIVMRALAEKPPKLEDLNLPEVCKKACGYSNGLVLVTGPTGSGKSTTLAAMVNYINENEKGHILTIEDPVEFQHESKSGIVSQRSLGQHFTNFHSALKAALREDPDTILIGEMRDPETIELAIHAAETGHLVFSTLHTNSAAKSVDRMIDVFPPEQQAQVRSVLSENLKVVIAQKLVPSKDGKKRFCIHDILVITPAVSNLIREGKTFQIPSVMQTSKKEGMQCFDQVLMEYVKKDQIDGVVAWEYANDKAMFSQYDPQKKNSVSTVTHQETRPDLKKSVA